VLHLLGDVPGNELLPLERGHVLEPVAEQLRGGQLAVGLALHHLPHRGAVTLIRLVESLNHRGLGHAFVT
jgi:hypothetical protein